MNKRKDSEPVNGISDSFADSDNLIKAESSLANEGEIRKKNVRRYKRNPNPAVSQTNTSEIPVKEKKSRRVASGTKTRTAEETAGELTVQQAEKNDDTQTEGAKPGRSRRRRTAQVHRAKEDSFEEAAGTAEVQYGADEVKKPARNTKRAKSLSVAEQVQEENAAKPSVKIIPLGGLEQIGMNITAFEYEESIIVVDCGLAFPADDMLGIDLVIPDVSYLKMNIDKVKGFVITHGHEDHIGALPYILKDIPVPVYATKLTMGIIEHKLKEHNLVKNTKRKVVKYGQSINLGSFRIEFIKTNHSIADAAALAIFSPAGIIVHTGDFKIDFTPVFGDTIDLQRFAELGSKGVLALMCDSTNVLRPGFTSSERTVGKTFDNIFAENAKNRIIVATFASNVDRVQQIINSAAKYGRKVVIEGRSMVSIVNIASELGYINMPENILIDIEQIKNYPDEQLVLITTGSQGETMAALSRMAASLHKKVSIGPGDTVILSSTPIPGNEKNVSKVINELSMKGAKVITQDTHVSGHACQEEIKMIYALTKPKHAIPVHGEYRHLMAQGELAMLMGVEKDNVHIISSGDVLELSETSGKIIDKVPAQGVLVDGLGVGDVGNIVLRDRQYLSENGLIIVVIALERYSNQVISGPDIISRGFVYVREAEDLMEEARQVVEDTLERCLAKNMSDWGKMKNEIKDSLSDFLWKRIKRNPMILPIIMEV